MGSLKDALITQDGEWDSAREMLVEHDILASCDIHSTYFAGSEDIKTIYPILNKMITNGEIVLGAGESRKDVTDLFLAVYLDNCGNDSCTVSEYCGIEDEEEE